MTAQSTSDQTSTSCWCCSTTTPEDGVVRLGDHPEVAICLDCAHLLHRRARERRATRAGRRLHRLGEWMRDAVVRSGLLDRPVLGGLLRRIDRHLPW
jgi:hypothetical protein